MERPVEPAFQMRLLTCLLLQDDYRPVLEQITLALEILTRLVVDFVRAQRPEAACIWLFISASRVPTDEIMSLVMKLYKHK